MHDPEVVIPPPTITLGSDTGPRFSDSFDTGKSVVVPVLRRRGVASIDMLVVSHSDNDHAGGADSVLALMEVRAIRSGSYELKPSIKFAAVSKRAVVAGGKWRWVCVYCGRRCMPNFSLFSLRKYWIRLF